MEDLEEGEMWNLCMNFIRIKGKRLNPGKSVLIAPTFPDSSFYSNLIHRARSEQRALNSLDIVEIPDTPVLANSPRGEREPLKS